MKNCSMAKRIESFKKNESSEYTVVRGSEGWRDCFMIDCKTSAKALALEDAFKTWCEESGGDILTVPTGGEVVQCWPVGRAFTFCIDPKSGIDSETFYKETIDWMLNKLQEF